MKSVLLLWLAAAAGAQPEAVAPIDEARIVLSIERAITGGRLIQAETMLGERNVGVHGDELDRLKATLALAQYQDREAGAQFRALMERHPDDCRLRSGAGISALRQGEIAEAHALLDRAVRECPNLSEAWAALAVALDGSQHWGESADAYRRAIILDPENSALLNNAGVSMLNQGRSREAIDFFRQALALDPGDRRAANNLDIARIRSGERPSFGRDGGITARAERLNNAGYAALQAGDEDSASRYFREAISLYPFRFEAAETNLKGADVAKGIQ